MSNGKSPVSETMVRAVLEEALGDRRLTRVDARAPLLHGGVITSIELVGVLLNLERHFGVRIPESAAPRLSIASVMQALGGDAAAPEVEKDAMQRRLHRSFRRFVLLLASIVIILFALDHGLRWLVEGPLAADYRAFLEAGRRLYPFSGTFSQDSFRFAVARHEISATPAAPEELRVGVFGDCGTVGSFVSAEDAMPAHLEAALKALGTPAKVYNLAWYGRLLPKDFMLLELVWERPLDVVVFTLSDDYLRKSTVSTGLDLHRHASFNWEILNRFKDRLPMAEQGPFRDAVGRLRRADIVQAGPLRRWGYEWSALLPYQPFLRYLVTVRWLPEPLTSPMREEMKSVGHRRIALSTPPPPLPPKLTPTDLDRTQLRMLASVIHLLERRGVRVLLYTEPVAPRAWRVDHTLTAASLAAKLAKETGSLFCDQSWALEAADFTDSLAHFTPDANRRLGEALAHVIRSSD